MLLGIYGIVFFVLNYYLYDLLPRGYKKAYFLGYTYLEYLVFAIIFWSNIRSIRVRLVIFISSLAFGLFQVFYFFNSQLNKIDAVPIGIETILIFIFIFLFFYSYFNNNTTEYIYNNYCFWISVGILIYLGGSFFLNILANNVSNITDYWYLTYIAETIKNILFSIAIVIISRKSNQISKGSNSNIPYLDLI